MTLKDPKIGNLPTTQESPIMTSDTNKEIITTRRTGGLL